MVELKKQKAYLKEQIKAEINRWKEDNYVIINLVPDIDEEKLVYLLTGRSIDNLLELAVSRYGCPAEMELDSFCQKIISEITDNNSSFILEPDRNTKINIFLPKEKINALQVWLDTAQNLTKTEIHQLINKKENENISFTRNANTQAVCAAYDAMCATGFKEAVEDSLNKYINTIIEGVDDRIHYRVELKYEETVAGERFYLKIKVAPFYQMYTESTKDIITYTLHLPHPTELGEVTIQEKGNYDD